MLTTVLILPGIGNSGSDHWQSLWEKTHPSFQRIQQRDWEHPNCGEWVETLDKNGGERAKQSCSGRTQRRMSRRRPLGRKLHAKDQGCVAGGAARPGGLELSEGGRRFLPCAHEAICFCKYCRCKFKRPLWRSWVWCRLCFSLGQPVCKRRSAWAYQCSEWIGRMACRLFIAAFTSRITRGTMTWRLFDRFRLRRRKGLCARCTSKLIDALGVQADATFNDLDPDLREALTVGRSVADQRE